ncbi:type VII secretion target [Candidatus Mycobacterium methanotrophicum]|uniref:ESX-1 secretion-associated protein n=1 Tax=Candidatus Mycobacterium methanotrophicum TaxID=2943498 RepID=A0ABY4QMX6_9MYCO|nr:type VII secretion target [Candidatus Mycobacterium methanotrophicum]UQX12224.1 ESX-1 secretion-associated protein [Candidatus Mycobacterium methanotrophicum]
MGQQNAFVDAAAMRMVANRFDDTAQRIDDALRTRVARLAFDGVTAGRAYTGHGDALRFALNRLAGELSKWARASVEIAAALRASADRYAEADLSAAGRVNLG